MDAVSNVTPEMALAAIDFWSKFIMLETVTFNEDLKAKLFS
jgi:hypothetical protein